MDGEKLHKSIFKIKEARCQMKVANAHLPTRHHPGDKTWEIYHFIRPYTKQVVPEFKLESIWLDFCKKTRPCIPAWYVDCNQDLKLHMSDFPQLQSQLQCLPEESRNTHLKNTIIREMQRNAIYIDPLAFPRPSRTWETILLHIFEFTLERICEVWKASDDNNLAKLCPFHKNHHKVCAWAGKFRTLE